MFADSIFYMSSMKLVFAMYETKPITHRKSINRPPLLMQKAHGHLITINPTIQFQRSDLNEHLKAFDDRIKKWGSSLATSRLVELSKWFASQNKLQKFFSSPEDMAKSLEVLLCQVPEWFALRTLEEIRLIQVHFTDCDLKANLDQRYDQHRLLAKVCPEVRINSGTNVSRPRWASVQDLTLRIMEEISKANYKQNAADWRRKAKHAALESIFELIDPLSDVDLMQQFQRICREVGYGN